MSAETEPAKPLRHRPPQDGLQFFSPDQAATVSAIAARVIPADDLGPSAAEAGAVFYVDRALAGAYQEAQPCYQRGLKALDREARARGGQPFARLSAEAQDDLLRVLESDQAPEFDWPSGREFFALVRQHVMEGYLSDPIYGGNRDFAGWRLVNFAGAVRAYNPDEVQSNAPIQRPFVSLAEWLPHRSDA